MAIDQTTVALNLCSKLSAAADALMRAVEAITAIGDQQSSAGINFTSPEVEAALEASSLKHASGTDFNNVLTSGTALDGWMADGFHDDVFQKVRSGGTS